MRLNPFKKDPVTKAEIARMKEVKAKAKRDLREIKKIADPALRAERYWLVSRALREVYIREKPPGLIDNSDQGVLFGIGIGGSAGVLAGCAIAASCAALPAAALPIVAVSSLVSAMGGGLFLGIKDGWEKRSYARAKYGSIRNARALYRLDDKIFKRRLKEERIAESFKHSTKKKEIAPASVPASPASAVNALLHNQFNPKTP